MKKYRVTMPIAGAFIVTVEADSEEAAIDAAAEVEWDSDFSTKDPKLEFHCHSLEVYPDLGQGNVCYLEYSEAEAEEIKDGAE